MTDLFGGNPTQEQVSQEPATQSQEPAAPAAQPAPTADPYTTMLAEIRAEDGRQKYADVQTALQSIPHAQGRISELSSKVQELEAELAKRQGAQEILEQLQSAPIQEPAPQAPSLDEASVAAIIEQHLTAKSAEDAVRANREKVVSALTAKYGDKAKDEFANKAMELGVTPDWLTQQAAEFPDFVLKQFNASAAQAPQPVTHGSVITEAVKPAPTEFKPVIRGATGSDVVDSYRAMLAQHNKG